jgi:hypothetical protein
MAVYKTGISKRGEKAGNKRLYRLCLFEDEDGKKFIKV